MGAIAANAESANLARGRPRLWFLNKSTENSLLNAELVNSFSRERELTNSA